MRKLMLVVAVLGLVVFFAPEVRADETANASKTDQMVIRVDVDQTKTLPQLIADGKYDWSYPDIPRLLKVESGSAVVPTEIILLRFGRSMTSQQILAEMNRLGLRPTTDREFLSVGIQHPELQREFPIVGLDPVVEVRGSRSVAVLFRYDSERRLGLGWFGVGWGGSYRFAAVRR